MSALRPTRPPAATPLHQRDSTLTSTSRTHGLHPGSMTSCCVDRGVRQHGEVGGMPDQDWSLRVTLVFQYKGTEWQLVHRHADPLVHAISMEHMAALARGHS